MDEFTFARVSISRSIISFARLCEQVSLFPVDAIIGRVQSVRVSSCILSSCYHHERTILTNHSERDTSIMAEHRSFLTRMNTVIYLLYPRAGSSQRSEFTRSISSTDEILVIFKFHLESNSTKLNVLIDTGITSASNLNWKIWFSKLWKFPPNPWITAGLPRTTTHVFSSPNSNTIDTDTSQKSIFNYSLRELIALKLADVNCIELRER